MIDPNRTLILICPVCKGKGEGEPWTLYYRMYIQQETICRGCFGEGYVTKARFHVLRHGRIEYETVSQVEYLPERVGV
jgi:hypothetical protein